MAANPMAHAHVYVHENFGPSSSSSTDPLDASRIPVLIAAADVRQKGEKLENCKEPLGLIVDSVLKAASDAVGSSGSDKVAKLIGSIDAISVVATWSWPYLDLPSNVATSLGLDPSRLKRREYTQHSGNQPIRLVDDACKHVAQGKVSVALVAAAEALKTLEDWRKKGVTEPPGWTPTSDDNKTGAAEKAGVVIKSPSARSQRDTSIKHGAYLAIHAYPLYENAIRAARKMSYGENMKESAELYGEFAKIASTVPSSWNYGEKLSTAQDIGTVSAKNRMISYPYPLLQNAFNTVNLASSILICSLATARSLGIPDSKLIYPLGGAGTQDPTDILERFTYERSPAIELSIEVACKNAGVRKEDVDAWDIYSCFPIVPKVAARYLGLPVLAPERKKPISVIGGLTSFGGAGNSYALHALVRMFAQIRDGNPGWKTGCVLGNGGFMTYQHAIVVSSIPPKQPYPLVNPLPAQLTYPAAPEIISELPTTTTLPVIVETYTIIYGRDGPQRAALICRVRGPKRERLVGNADLKTVLGMQEKGVEIVGSFGTATGKGDGLNWITIEEGGASGRAKM